MTKITEVASKTSNNQSSMDYLKDFSKRMLKTQLFVGTFQEKRYVEPLNTYRHIVKVDSDEKQFIENVMIVSKRLRQELSEPWIGITGPNMIGAPVGCNLWVDLPIEVLGTYWFKVKTVEFLENEVRAKLEVVRPVKNEKSISDISDVEDFDLKTTVQDLSNSFKINTVSFVKTYITLTNIRSSVVFVALLLGTIVAGGFNVVKYLMEYLLKFMREFSSLIKVCTPIIISVIEFVRKVIYGLFSLIAVLVRGKPTHQPTYMDQNHMLPYGGTDRFVYTRPALTYNSVRNRAKRSSVRITEMDD